MPIASRLFATRTAAIALGAAITLAACQASPGLHGRASFSLAPVVTASEASAVFPRASTSEGAGSVLPGPPSMAKPASGGGASSVTGLVLGLAGGEERPLASAEVSTTDGRRATTDAAGRFTLPGAPPADGVYLASHRGYIASVIAGLPADAPVRLHLQSPVLITPSEAEPIAFQVSGQLVDADGLPLEGVLVVLADRRGSASNPDVSGPDGAFTLTVQAPEGRVEDGTLLAAGATSETWLGLATGLDLSAEASAIAPLRLTPARHRLRLTLDATAVEAPARAVVELVGPEGVRLGLPSLPGDTWVAPLPGAHYALRAEAVDTVAGVSSEVHRERLPIDFSQSETSHSETLLAPPSFAPPPTLEPGAPIAWSPVSGANGYQLSLAALDGPGFIWEGFASAPTLAFSFRGPLSPGRYGLTVTAWDEPRMTSRAVAAAPASLRVLPIGEDFRSASRQIRLSL